MDYLWSPWRYRYVSGSADSPACIFCEHPRDADDKRHYILHRGRHCFTLLNLYPYTTGHLMVAPYAHAADLSTVSGDALSEMMAVAQRAERALRAEYKPEGFNAGFNIGKCAGAGVAGHVHLHMLPRWFADSNFMTVVGETRVLPEDLDTTFEKLRPHFAGPGSGH